MKQPVVFLIIAVLFGGIFATAFYYSGLFGPPDCGTPPVGGTPRLVLGIGYVSVNGQNDFWEQNVTFTAGSQQVSMRDVVYRSSIFFDPSFPHLVGNRCESEPNAPFRITLLIQFTDNNIESFSFTYGGSPPAPQVTYLTTHQNPQAGVRWVPGTDYLGLLVTPPSS